MGARAKDRSIWSWSCSYARLGVWLWDSDWGLGAAPSDSFEDMWHISSFFSFVSTHHWQSRVPKGPSGSGGRQAYDFSAPFPKGISSLSTISSDAQAFQLAFVSTWRCYPRLLEQRFNTIVGPAWRMAFGARFAIVHQRVVCPASVCYFEYVNLFLVVYR